MFQTIFDQENKQWNGVQSELDFVPKTSLGSAILESLHVNGSKVAEVKRI